MLNHNSLSNNCFNYTQFILVSEAILTDCFLTRRIY